MMEAIVLCGGIASRLQPIAKDVPKSLLPVGGRPFLEWQLIDLKRQGVERIVLATGHLGEKIEEALGDGSSLGVQLVYSRETSALGTGGALRLARVVGKNKAMEMTLTSKPIDAVEAHRIGLANALYSADQLMPAAVEMAEQIAALPPLAVRLAKESLNKGLDTGSIKEAAQADLYRFLALMQTEDRDEGHQAWRERRKPIFAGR